MPSRKREREDSPTIHDVAARAGVSSQTVSRVINGSPNVKESTRIHVLSVVEDSEVPTEQNSTKSGLAAVQVNWTNYPCLIRVWSYAGIG